MTLPPRQGEGKTVVLVEITGTTDFTNALPYPKRNFRFESHRVCIQELPVKQNLIL